jgi:hypothetical protein
LTVGKSLSIKFDPSLLNQQLDNIGGSALAAVRPAAQAGAQVLYDEVKLNVGRIKKKTGNLDASIYQVYSTDNSTHAKATYHISWNARKAPHGHLVEYGHLMTRKAYIGSDGKWYTSKVKIEPKHVAARPFLRPAWDAKRFIALQAAEARWIAETSKAL